MLLSDPFHITQPKKRDTLQHEAYNFRYGIFTHKYDTLFLLYKIACQQPSNEPNENDLSHGEKSWLKRISDGGQELSD